MSENWIDLSNVPKYKGTGTRGKYVYDWKNASGSRCDFYCEGVTGYFIIKDYNKERQEVTVTYNNEDKKLRTNYILKCLLRTLIGLRNKDFKVSIGTIFTDNNRHMEVTGRELKPDSKGTLRKMYSYHCHICGWKDGWIDEGHLLNGIGCSCCAKTVIVPYVNDVYTTNPELIKYFKNIEDTHTTTNCSKRKVQMICPNCGDEKIYTTADLYSHGFACRKCSDGISYGEKFMYSLLKGLNIDFITQLSRKQFSWCDKYKYDFYIPNINAIIEVHGRQHYMEEDRGVYKCCKETDEYKEI